MFHLKWLLYFSNKQKCQGLNEPKLTLATRPISEQGLSLIECLMAIVVIALTGAMMLPPLFVATANRVQNRKAEQALQLAQGEVDRVRALVEQKAQNAGNLPKVATGVTQLNAVSAPTKISDITRSSVKDCNSTNLPAVSELLKIDLDGDCEPEFLIQVFRTESNNDQFELGVRVYASSAKPPSQLLETEEASLKYTTGTGNQNVRPLAVLYTEIKSVNAGQSMCNFQNHATCN